MGLLLNMKELRLYDNNQVSITFSAEVRSLLNNGLELFISGTNIDYGC